VDGSGNVTLAANAKVTAPDGTDAPFIYTFNAAANRYGDGRDSVPVIGSTAMALEVEGDGYAYIRLPVHNDVLGANVVLDRITIYCSQQDGTGQSITEIALVDDTDTVARSYSSTITSDTQWLTSDFTMNDSRSYVIRILFDNSAVGHMDITRFKVEYHLE